jgi:hypothetical protein
MYHCHNTKHVHVELGNACFQDTGVLECFIGCQPGKQQDCGNLKFCSYLNYEILNLSWCTYFKYFSLHLNTFKTILIVHLMFLNFYYKKNS